MRVPFIQHHDSMMNYPLPAGIRSIRLDWLIAMF